MARKITTQIMLTPRQRKILFAWAKRDGVSLAELVRQAIDEMIEREQRKAEKG